MQTNKKQAWLFKAQPTERVNLCPHCGEHPQFLTNGESYILRCPKCNNEEAFSFEVWDGINRFLLCKLWNLETTEVPYSSEVMETLGIKNGQYIVFNSNDYSYLERFDCINDALKFMRTHCENDNSYETHVYHMCNNELRYLFHFDTAALTQGWKGFDPDDLPW